MTCFFFFKQKTAYELRISDWSSDVCSSDLILPLFDVAAGRVLDRLLLASAGDARAFGGGFRVILLRDPADPVRPPAALGLGRARDKIAERRGLIVAGPILIFARCGRVDHARDMARAREQETIGRAHV